MKHRTLVSFLFLLFVPLASAQLYTITDLGPLSPTAINAWGLVTGNRNGHAFIWSQFTGSKDLGTLPGGTSSLATAINDRGAVAGVADGFGTVVSPSPYIPNQTCTDLIQPFVWTPRGGMSGLSVAGIESLSFWWCDVPYFASDINISGQVVGSNEEYQSYKFGFLWTSANGMSLFEDDYETSSNGINNRGQVVGQTSSAFLSEVSHAVLWSQGVKTDLGTLGGPDPHFSYLSGANSINDVGEVVGWSTVVPGTNGYTQSSHAFLWKQGSGMQDLGTLPGDTFSVALKINCFGLVIGNSGNSVVWQDGEPGGSLAVIGHPFLWTKHNGMRDLNALIPSASNWVLNTATGINIWGQIVGSGTIKGQTHGFLLTPTFF